MSHQTQGFIRKYIFSTDHKTIGAQFLITGALFAMVGGFLAMMMRWQLAYPGQPLPIIGGWFPQSMLVGGVMLPEFYNVLFTMHGSVMIFLVVIPILVGAFGNFLIPLQIGTKDMAFPVLNMVSYWMIPPAGFIMLLGFFVEGNAAAAGWTSYPPLSVIAQGGQTCWIVGLILIGTSSIIGAVNYVTTILNLRAPGMGFFRMPMAVWSLFVTALLAVLATPVLSAALIMLLFDQTLGTSFFLPAGMVVSGEVLARDGGQPLLWQHLFWFYSHPAVYIMILPAMGMVSDILPVFARKPLFGYRAMVFSLLGIAGLGFIVWGHHMFQSGMNPILGTSFMVSTVVIAVPSAVKTFNWLGTLWRGQIQLTTPMLNALAFVSMFVIGGLSGVFLAAAPVDIFLHDTYFIVAHLHYVLFGGSLFGIFAATTFWFPKMFGRLMSEKLGKIHFVFTFIAYNLTFFPMHSMGIGGMMRRIYDPTQYTHLQAMQPLNIFVTISAFVLGAVQLIFIFNFFSSIFFGKKADRNPWEANTLEWTTPSPPPHGNFETIPTVYRGPYEYSHPQVSKDWLAQNAPN